MGLCSATASHSSVCYALKGKSGGGVTSDGGRKHEKGVFSFASRGCLYERASGVASSRHGTWHQDRDHRWSGCTHNLHQGRRRSTHMASPCLDTIMRGNERECIQRKVRAESLIQSIQRTWLRQARPPLQNEPSHAP